MTIYLARARGRIAMIQGEPDPDAYVSGPYTSTDDAHEALQERESIEYRSSEYRKAMALFVGCGALVWLVSWVLL
jgi:hypothetical protein